MLVWYLFSYDICIVKLFINFLNFIKMEKIQKFENCKIENMQEIKGGRTVVKIDKDGDGRWDEKRVYDKYGNLKKVKFR